MISRLAKSEKVILLFLILLSLITWIDPFSFFKGDDWIFIIDFANGSFISNLITAHGAHVIPFFKAIYYFELLTFGKNAILFQIVSVILWGSNCFVVYLILKQISENINPLQLLIAAAVCLHPDFSDIIYWIFQQGVIFHMLFQSMAILFYLKFLKNYSSRNYIWFLAFLLTQNYFFGNGIFFPLLFICHYIFNKRKILFDRYLVSLLTLQLLFIIVQQLLSHQQIPINEIISNRFTIFQAWINLIEVSLTRFIFIKPTGGAWMVYISFLVFVLICYKAYKTSPEHFLFAFLFLLVSSISIPIARVSIAQFQFHEIHYYYSTLLFPPLFLLFFIALSEYNFKYSGIFQFSVFLCFAALFIINLQSKRIYSYRNFKNKEFLMTAINYGKKNYYPYDDAIFSSQKNIYLDHIGHAEIQKSIQKTNYFGADSVIINYMGNDAFLSFIENNRNVLKSYTMLSEQSKVNLDIEFEKY